MRHLAILLVRLYQSTLAPFARGSCRFTPSCSEYAIEAFRRHGFLRGQAGREGANYRATQSAWPRTLTFLRTALE